MAKILFLFVIIASSAVTNGQQSYGWNVQFSSLDYALKKISTIYLKIGTETKQVPVMVSEKGKTYLIFQRRLNGEVDFYRNWNDYVNGFGNPEGEYWIGLNALNILTSSAKYDMTVFLEDFKSATASAHYGIFEVGDAASKYILKIGQYSGTAGDAMLVHDGMMFSTYDNDNDGKIENCALNYHGGWWYHLCHEANLNGKYYPAPGKPISFATGVNWKQFRGFQESLKTSVMALSLK